MRQIFSEHDVAVVGLHTVFEHHAVMTVDALRAFIHEYRWSFPIGVDQASTSGDVPLTMAAYGLRGTPSHIVLDRQGFVRKHQLGRIEDRGWRVHYYNVGVDELWKIDLKGKT